MGRLTIELASLIVWLGSFGGISGGGAIEQLIGKESEKKTDRYSAWEGFSPLPAILALSVGALAVIGYSRYCRRRASQDLAGKLSAQGDSMAGPATTNVEGSPGQVSTIASRPQPVPQEVAARAADRPPEVIFPTARR